MKLKPKLKWLFTDQETKDESKITQLKIKLLQRIYDDTK